LALTNLEKVLDHLATSEKTTIVVERAPDGKMRVTSSSWDGKRSFSRIKCSKSAYQRVHVARKAKKPDEWNPPIEPY
jgi:hypothetical protein